jgi:hypothetical protein
LLNFLLQARHVEDGSKGLGGIFQYLSLNKS